MKLDKTGHSAGEGQWGRSEELLYMKLRRKVKMMFLCKV